MLRIVNERSDALPALADVFREHGFDAASLSLFSAFVRSGVEPDLAAQRAEGTVLAIQGALVLTRAFGDEEVVAQRLIAKADLEQNAQRVATRLTQRRRKCRALTHGLC